MNITDEYLRQSSSHRQPALRRAAAAPDTTAEQFRRAQRSGRPLNAEKLSDALLDGTGQDTYWQTATESARGCRQQRRLAKAPPPRSARDAARASQAAAREREPLPCASRCLAREPRARPDAQRSIKHSDPRRGAAARRA